MKISIRTAIGCGAVGMGGGLHLLTQHHPVLGLAAGAASVVWIVADERRRGGRPAADAEVDTTAAATDTVVAAA